MAPKKGPKAPSRAKAAELKRIDRYVRALNKTMAQYRKQWITWARRRKGGGGQPPPPKPPKWP